jgi:hypothetical protein
MVAAGALMTLTSMHVPVEEKIEIYLPQDSNTMFDLRPRKTTVRFAIQPFLQDSYHEHHEPLRAATVGNWRSRNRNSTTGVGVRF